MSHDAEFPIADSSHVPHDMRLQLLARIHSIFVGEKNVAIQSKSNMPMIRGCQRQEVSSQIAEYATPSIWGNPTVICVGSNAEV